MAKRDKNKNKPISPTEGEILHIKIGGGSFHFKGKIIKPKQTFLADPDEIPKGFRDIVKPIEDKPENRKKPKVPAVPTYKKVKIEKGDKKGKWNVVNSDGKVLNEKPLNEKDADALIETFS